MSSFFERKQSWKNWAGRKDGSEEYTRGDVRRGIANALWSTIPWVGTTDPHYSVEIMNALSLARMGVENIDHGVKSFRDLGFPPDEDNTLETISKAMDTIRSALDQLENMCEAARREGRSSVGGKLLQMQMCVARRHQEWSVGQLVIRRTGLFFESKSESKNQVPWCIGPVLWENVDKLELLLDGDVALGVKGEPGTYMLSGVSDLEWLKKLGGLIIRSPSTAVSEAGSFCSAIDGEDLEDWIADLRSPRDAENVSFNSLGQMTEASLSPVATHDSISDGFGALATKAESTKSMNGTISLPTVEEKTESLADSISRLNSGSPKSPSGWTSTFHKAAAELPPAEPPKKAKPVFSEILIDVSIEFIRKAFSVEQDWPVLNYLQQEAHAHDFKTTPWADGHRISGTKVRRVQFKMPVPADVPQAVKSLVKLPDETAVTILARIGSTDDVVVILSEVVSHDVAYGNNFVVQEVLNFRRHAEKGVCFEKYVEIKWVIALPWYARIVETFVEMKAKADGKTSGEFLARYLKAQPRSSGE